MDNRSEVRAFLSSRRAKVSPAQAGIPAYGSRRVAGELSMHSEPFRGWWAAQDVHGHRHGVKRFRHPTIGVLELAHEALELPGGDTPLTVVTYTAVPGTPSGDGLELLATWAATDVSHSRTVQEV